MTDPEFTTQDPPTAPAAAAPTAAPAQPDPAYPDLPAGGRRRGKRRAWLALAGAAVAGGLIAGLLAWAPWIPPPVLRPAGLVAGPATATAISFRWSRPPGPLPDKYLILRDGKVIASVAGTSTSYQRIDLTPAASYRYRLVAVRGGKRSPQSAQVTVRTRTPPIAQARLQGSWSLTLTYPRHVVRRRRRSLFWRAVPACQAGPCDVTILQLGRDKFTLQLARAGGVYHGRVMVGFLRCGHGANSMADPTTLTFRVHITAAAGKHHWWAATALAGTMTETSRYVSNSVGYCTASSVKATLSGNSR